MEERRGEREAGGGLDLSIFLCIHLHDVDCSFDRHKSALFGEDDRMIALLALLAS